MFVVQLLAARKSAKAQMKTAANEFDAAVYNGKQLALKICANSVYGFCGARTGSVPCVFVSGAVTAYGREMIDNTADFVKKHYDGETVYGDTDSVRRIILFVIVVVLHPPCVHIL